jgi:hypothetical protein
MDKYEFGKCLYCGKDKALKNGVCIDCKNKTDLPDCFKDIFEEFNQKEDTNENRRFKKDVGSKKTGYGKNKDIV